MRTQNPPPLKACRFDSDLGHHSNSLVYLRSPTVAGASSQNAADFLSVSYRFCSAKFRSSLAHSLHIR